MTTEAQDEALYLTYKARIYPNSEQRRAIAADIENSLYVHKRCPSFHDMYRTA